MSSIARFGLLAFIFVTSHAHAVTFTVNETRDWVPGGVWKDACVMNVRQTMEIVLPEVFSEMRVVDTTFGYTTDAYSRCRGSYPHENCVMKCVVDVESGSSEYRFKVRKAPIRKGTRAGLDCQKDYDRLDSTPGLVMARMHRERGSCQASALMIELR